ncbi:hypothetical protein KKHFBJBL_02527 [Brevundimonas sp. NIBR11]|nr:hypothetical protein KKHFBJBL_02527 [Brevundimonas sp. NIBR11]
MVLLARDLCAFSFFETAALPRGRRAQAARLYAKTASPYVVSVSNLVKVGADYGVWWWDIERVAPLVGAVLPGGKPRLRPETLAQPKTSGWRTVKLADGYEAQLWRDQGLVASVWSRVRFDPASWIAFTRLQRLAPAADSTPPPAQTLPIAGDSEALSLAPPELTREQAIALAVAAVPFALVSLSLYLAGQTFALSRETDALRQETMEIQQATPRTAAAAAPEVDRQKLQTYGRIEARTNPLSAVGAAIGVVAIHDLTPTAVDAGEDTLSLTLPYASVSKAAELIAEFEESGYFFDVRPRTNAANQSIIIEMKVREGAPPLSAGA